MQIFCCRRQLFFLVLVFCILTGLFIVGCNPQEDMTTNQEKEDNMNNNDGALETTIPPIDKQIPMNIETATFALG